MERVAELPEIRHAVPLAPFTSLKVGGPADLFLEARSVDEAFGALHWAGERGLDCRWIGGGSNLLVSAAGLAGLGARFLASRHELPGDDEGDVVVEAGRSFPNLAGALGRIGWSGLEWAANVPGTIGGAVVNNAGAFGSSVAETLVWAELLLADGRIERLASDDLGYAYRTSRLKRRELGPALVVRAAFRVRRASAAETQARLRELRERRTASQPRQLSAGSVFANPPDDFAGRLIDAAGLKGRRIGGAQISPRHANFIVNVVGATASDVYALMRLAQDEVWRRFGRWLTPEIELIGRWSEAERAALSGPR